MRENIRRAITIGECSMVVEAKQHAQNMWSRDFSSLIRRGRSLGFLIGSVMNEHYPPIQGYRFWSDFRARYR